MEEVQPEAVVQLGLIAEYLAAANQAQADEYPLSVMRTVALCFGGIGAFFGACAAFYIPRRIADAASQRERRIATLNLIRDIKASPTVLERLTRTYAYRRYREGLEGYNNPYRTTHYTFEHDLICILNFFDVACAEIEAGYVELDLLKVTVDDMVVGAYKQVPTLAEITEEDEAVVRDAYPHLTKLGAKWSGDVPDAELKVPELRTPTEKT